MDVVHEAESLARRLAKRDVRVVFAESCTAGLVAALLARVPGVSEYLCGLAVTYRSRTKHDWLAVPQSDLDQYTAVSEPVARAMASAVLERTQEADFSAAVTGHLGPDAPKELDGVVYVAVARRTGEAIEILGVWRHELRATTRHEQPSVPRSS